MNEILTRLATAAAVEPTSPDVGDVWIDSRTGEALVWDGTYWKVGDLVRVETSVAVPAAPGADVDIGWNVPTGFAVVKVSVKLLKAITGAGGCTKVGCGTKVAGNPDKFALTPTLLADAVHQTINPTWNDGSGGRSRADGGGQCGPCSGDHRGVSCGRCPGYRLDAASDHDSVGGNHQGAGERLPAPY